MGDDDNNDSDVDSGDIAADETEYAGIGLGDPPELPKPQENMTSEGTTATDRKQQIDAKKASKSSLQILSAGAQNNLDAGVGSLSYFFVWLAANAYTARNWADVVIYIGVAGVLTLAKHKIPDGAWSIWLKKPAGEVVDDIKKSIMRS